VVTEHPNGYLVYDPDYLNIRRSDEVVFIQITLNQGRSLELKKALYARIAELLHQEVGLRKEDVLINLIEVPKEKLVLRERRGPVRNVTAWTLVILN